ncbi:conserved hypothetical protein [Pyrobaculum islandicum DSM 4184]|uniref:Uncharacterized protein n=1 Tax=Pyrobaculum islandicum (strain DSM 4184 / JCM 9189 / GEO3) TaxID=384616 RepID=A1RTE5_PYRIL|nr:hypothetical protein [Pyrobaculum islandicum]ABL88227.1 conserved hypothetical protein [Pyrobaculum islandicum DSM 4184]
MLKIDEILKRLEEIDKVIKSADETKTNVLIYVEQVSKKYSDEIIKKIEGIVSNAIFEYKNKAVEEAKKEAEKIIKSAEDKKEKILSKYRENKNKLIEKALAILNL